MQAIEPIDIIRLATTDFMTAEKDALDRELPALEKLIQAKKDEITALELQVRAKKCRLKGIREELRKNTLNGNQASSGIV